MAKTPPRTRSGTARSVERPTSSGIPSKDQSRRPRPRDRLTNTERFWLEYKARGPPQWVSGQEAPANPYELRFWLEYIERPLPIRNVSAPPAGRRPLPPYSPPRQPSLRSKLLFKFRSIRRRLGTWLSTVRRRLTPSRRTALLALLATTAGGYLATNTYAYMNQPPVNIPAILDPALSLRNDTHGLRYAAEPTWLYTSSPSQLLGFPEPLFPRGVQNAHAVEKQVRKSFKHWGPDSRYKHGDANPGKDNMEKIANRFNVAKEKIHKVAPYMYNSDKMWRGMLDEAAEHVPYNPMDNDVSFLKDDGLPHYKPGCVCTVAQAVKDGLKHAVLPYWKHNYPPQTAEELAQYCPCSIKKAVDRLRYGYQKENLPPLLSRFYKDPVLTSRWDPGSWFLTRWGNNGPGNIRAARDVPAELVEKWREEGWLGDGSGKRGGDMPLQGRRGYEGDKDLSPELQKVLADMDEMFYEDEEDERTLD